MSSHTLETDDVRIVYDVTGEGPPVLLLHGGSADSSWWGDLVPALAKRHTVITVDSRGHGRSSLDDRQITYRRMANDTLALLDRQEIEQVDIVGWSDGAIIALDIALRQPARLRRVVAYGVNFDLSGYRGSDAEGKSSPGAERFMAENPGRYQADSPAPERWDEFLANLHQMWTTEPNWTRDDMRSIQTPILVLDGIEEEVIDIDHVRLLAKLLPNGTLELMPSTGHFAMVDQPAEFTQIVLNYLEAPETP